jgi:tRNA uridine 5-carboxymethylaminomethyl modification enzyme
MESGHRMGLVPSWMMDRLREKEQLVRDGIEIASLISLSPAAINPYLQSIGSEPISENERLGKLAKRTGARLSDLMGIDSVASHPYVTRLRDRKDERLVNEVVEQVEIELKYEGYITRQIEQVERFDKYETDKIPEDVNYGEVKSLSSEGREKLSRVRPSSLGQASRISGVTPSDVSILMVYLKG